jgi:glycosyltransferase involved in cell wall biosynthesis
MEPPSEPSLHVAFVLPSLVVGGMERFVVLLGTALVQSGHQATVICTQTTGELAESARSNGMAVVCSPFTSRWDNLRPTRLIRELAGVRPDVIHSQNGVWLAAALAARRLGVPMCHTEHGIESLTEPLKVTSQKFLAARLTDAIVAVSTPLEARLSAKYRIPRARLSRIDNGIPTELYRRQPAVREAVRQALGVTEETIVIGAVARLHHLKGIDVLMQAAQTLERGDRPVCIVVAGDGEDRSLVEQMAARAGVPVQLLGMHSDIDRLMQAFDIFALPSRSEGLPLAVLEAMAAGCAIVATDVGEVRRVLESEAGLVVESGNVTALAVGLRLLIHDDAMRDRFSVNAMYRVRQQFGIEQMAARYLRLYRQIVPSPPSH